MIQSLIDANLSRNRVSEHQECVSECFKFVFWAKGPVWDWITTNLICWTGVPFNCIPDPASHSLILTPNSHTLSSGYRKSERPTNMSDWSSSQVAWSDWHTLWGWFCTRDHETTSGISSSSCFLVCLFVCCFSIGENPVPLFLSSWPQVTSFIWNPFYNEKSVIDVKILFKLPSQLTRRVGILTDFDLSVVNTSWYGKE